MTHDIPLITTLAAAFALALLLGFAAERCRLPALVGYLLAGILIGPGTPGFVADVHLAAQLSEIGVMLLMFGVGLHFSIADLLAVRRVALPGAIVQMACATCFGLVMALYWGWPWGQALLFGVSLSCASTVVLIKALEARGILSSMNGQIAVGWLVVEDLVTVLVLVLLPPLAGVLGGAQDATLSDRSILWTVCLTLLEVCSFIALMLLVGRRVIPWVLWHIAGTGSRELFTLAVIAAAIGIAFGAAHFFSVSFALGAFFAGMVMRESEFAHRAANESLPLRDAFSVLFFVSVGMLFDPEILLERPEYILGVVTIIMFGKTLAAFLLVVLLNYPLNTALTVAASLAQIGEFSFILAGLGLELGLMSQEGMSLILAGALFSIALNPLLFSAIEPVRSWALRTSAFARKMEARGDPYAELPQSTASEYLKKQVVLVGYGRLGRQIADLLQAQKLPFVIADQNRQVVEGLRRRGVAAVSGDAVDPSVLIQAHVMHASMLVIATSDPVHVKTIVDTAKTLNPEIEIVVRAHSEEESVQIHQAHWGTAFLGEVELAKGMAAHVIERLGVITSQEDAGKQL